MAARRACSGQQPFPYISLADSGTLSHQRSPYSFGVDLSTIANSTVILTTSVRGLISFVAMSLPKKMPELWEKSAFHISEGKLKAVCTVSIFLTAISVLMLFMTSSMAQICGNCCIFAAAVILMILFGKNVKVTANFAEK